MIKIIDLGFEVPETGERRITLIDDSMVKTASNDIQSFWSSFPREKDKGYLHVIAMTDGNIYGPNNNGDWFDGADLKKYHPSFTKDGHVFMFHMNKDPKKAIGKPIYSFYNDHMSRVELVLEFNKTDPGAVMLVTKLKNNEQVYVSMGVKVDHDVCSVCNHPSKTRNEYCDHLRYNMKKILPDGRQVFAKNPGPLKFFDISVVNKPADKVAWALEKEASSDRLSSTEVIKTSAERGEEYTDHQMKLAGLKKISDMIKQVDGDIADMDTQDKEPAYTRLRRLKEQNVRHLEYPVLDYSTLDTMDASPGGMIRVILSTGAPPSIGELAYAAGKHAFGNRMDESVIPRILRMIPSAIQLIKGNPSLMDSVPAMMSNYDGELENPNRYENLRQQIQPVMSRRIMIIKMACEDGQLEKLAAGVVYPGVPQYKDKYDYEYSKAPVIRLAKDIVNSAVNPGLGALDQVHVRGKDGQIVATNRHNMDRANTVGKFLPTITDVLGAAIIAAGGMTMLSDASAMEKLVTAVLTAGIGSSMMFLGKNDPKIQTREHIEIPSHTPLFRGEQGIRKTATAVPAPAPGTGWADMMKTHGPAILGMAVPAVLGLDYLYNRHIKYRNEPYPEEAIEGFPSRMAYKAGRTVMNNPLSTIVGGGVLGTLGKEYLAGKFKKK